jgi:hypothetical protein
MKKKPSKRVRISKFILRFIKKFYKKKKGGDPSAPSRTDTLLRLNPHRRENPPPAYVGVQILPTLLV